MLAGSVLQLEPRLSHGDAQRLRFGAAGHHTPVVVRKDDDRQVLQAGIEQLLAAGIKIVIVEETEDRHVTPRTV